MNTARWTRPNPGHTAAQFHAARIALSDAQHAGDPTTAARILMHTAARIAADDAWWCHVRPPLGRLSPLFPRTQQQEAA